MKVLLLTLMIALTSLAQQTGNAEKRFDIEMPPTNDADSMAISPDGQNVVYMAVSETRQRLWLRDLNSGATRPLAGTEDVSLPFPFWSPDGKSIGFFKDREIHRFDLETGRERLVVTWSWGRGGTWNKDHTILFATPQGAIMQVSDSGGAVTPVTQLNVPRESQHLFPSFLPDGRHFLYYVVGTEDVSGIYVGDVAGSPGKRIRNADSPAVYATSGQILFTLKGKLLAQDFDLTTMNVTMNPFQVAEKVSMVDRAATISTSSSGHVAYRSEAIEKQLAWFDRSGKRLGLAGGPMNISVASMSRDGRRVALGRTVDGNPDIWLLDLISGVNSRLTTSLANDTYPLWSLDDRRIAFSANRNNFYELYEKRSPFDGPESLILPEPMGNMTSLDWSPDGRVLLARINPYNMVAVQMEGLSVVPVATSSADNTIYYPQFSTDGKWLAFSSNRTGREEIHIAPFSPGSTFQPSARVSINGGAWPRWAQNGKELFYVAPGGMLMAVPFDTSTGQTKSPAPLFNPHMATSVGNPNAQQYMVASDGRFLVIAAEDVQSPIHVISNLQQKN